MPSSKHALGAYLRRVADALAAPSATTDQVLAAARAHGVRTGRSQAVFRPPDPHLVRGTMAGSGLDGTGPDPESVTFECDTLAAPVRLRDIEAVFGAWSGTPKPATELPIWPVRFDRVYRPPGEATAGGGAVVVLARTSAPPARSDVLVVEVVLLRQPGGAR